MPSASRSRCRTVAGVSSGTFWLRVPRSGLASTATTRSPRIDENVAPSVAVIGGFADTALQRQHRDAVATPQRLVHLDGQVVVPDHSRAFADVDQLSRQAIQPAAPTLRWRRLDLAQQRAGGQLRIRRKLRGRRLLPPTRFRRWVGWRCPVIAVAQHRRIVRRGCPRARFGAGLRRRYAPRRVVAEAALGAEPGKRSRRRLVTGWWWRLRRQLGRRMVFATARRPGIRAVRRMVRHLKVPPRCDTWVAY